MKEDEEQEPTWTYLKKGDYYGENALLTHWASEYNIVSEVFTVVETLSRIDFEVVKDEYPEIEMRLKKGLKDQKHFDKELHGENLSHTDICEGIEPKKLEKLYLDYFVDVYIDPGTVIQGPYCPANAIYYIIKGTVNVFFDPRRM